MCYFNFKITYIITSGNLFWQLILAFSLVSFNCELHFSIHLYLSLSFCNWRTCACNACNVSITSWLLGFLLLGFLYKEVGVQPCPLPLTRPGYSGTFSALLSTLLFSWSSAVLIDWDRVSWNSFTYRKLLVEIKKLIIYY